MKKFLIIILLLFVILPAIAEEKAVVSKTSVQTDTEVYMMDNVDLTKYSISAQQFIDKNACKEVEAVIKKSNKSANKKDIATFKNLISENYVNNDGFNRQVLLERMKQSWNSYPDLKFKTAIKEIKINDCYAKVWITDIGKGKVVSSESPSGQKGLLTTYSDGIIYLQKFGYDWKIQSEFVVNEKIVLLYGDAKLMKMDLFAPDMVPANSDYTVKLQVDVPENYYLFASLNNEKIVTPQSVPDEIFKNLSDDGTLERVLKSNEENKNEYAVASIGITKPTIKEDNKIDVKITGMALITTRVNVTKIN